MPTHSFTLKIRGDAYAPEDMTWEANWSSWHVIPVPVVPVIFDFFMPTADPFGLDLGYVENYPNTTAGPLADTGSYPFPDHATPIPADDASIVITGPPEYQGYITGEGHEWTIGVTVTTPDFIFGQSRLNAGSSDAVMVYVPAPYYEVVVRWPFTEWGGGSIPLGIVDAFIGGAAEPIFDDSIVSPGFESFDPPPPAGNYLSVSQEENGDEFSMEVSNTTGEVVFYGWQFLDSNHDFVGHSGIEPFSKGVSVEPYIDGEPWGPYEETGQTVEYDGDGVWVRAVAFDEHGYFGTNEVTPMGRFREIIGGVRVSAISDRDGVAYAAVRVGNNVEVQEFKNGTATKVVKATIENADSPGIYQHKNDSTIYVTVRDKSSGAYKIYFSDDFGSTFTFMANSPFASSDYKPTRPCGLDGGGHAQAAWKKGTDEVWFAYSWDGTTWSTPTLAFSLSNLKGVDIYQESASNSDVIVITAINDTGTHLKHTTDLGATTPWPDYA